MKILLLSDAPMCVDAGGMGQTLYNLFSFVDPEDILGITSYQEFISTPPSEPFASRYITYKFEIMDIPRNRNARYMAPFINWLNFSFNTIFNRFKKIQQQILQFNPDVVISCPNSPEGLFMNNKLLKGLAIKNIIPYFMDDMPYNKTMSWVGGNVQKSTVELLSNKRAWLMISSNLATIFEERYKIKPDAMLVVHNPVDISNVSELSNRAPGNEITLAYAGSMWPMHFDSLLVIAKAITKLNLKKKVQLVVYTRENLWEWRKAALIPLGVKYGGSIPYKDIQNKLDEADALLLASSFSEEYYSVSKSSLQTKMTDYLKARKLIISCGPVYSANHDFLKKHNCGLCIETENIEVASDQLSQILNNISGYQYMVSNGWKLLNDEFTFEKVHRKLNDFITRNTI